MIKLKNKHEKLYGVWKSMRQRCLNPNNGDYKYYGARGIKVCHEWTNFDVFCNRTQTITKWAEELNIDPCVLFSRIDAYKWDPQKALSMPIIDPRIKVLINGKTYTIKELSKITGLKPQTIRRRIERGKVNEELIEPLRVNQYA